jgi:outer membrane protein assembly factor BamB
MAFHGSLRRSLLGVALAGMVFSLIACSVGSATDTGSTTSTTSPTGTGTVTGTGTAGTTPTATATTAGATPSPTATASGPTLSQQTVYVGSDNNTFYGVNAATGAKRWSYPLGDTANKPSANNGIVYGTTYGGEVFAINAGSILWHTTPGSGTQSRPAIDPNTGLLFIGSEDNSIYALRMSDGSTVWHYPTGGNITGSLYFENNLVFSGSEDGYIYALHESSGTLAWRTSISAVEYASPTGDGSKIYIGADDGHVFALNENNGSIAWKYQTGGQILAKPAIFNGVVYIGSNDDNEYALNASNGNKIWQYGLPDSVGTSVLTNGFDIVSASDGTVVALVQSNGHVGWTKHIGGNARDWFSTTLGVVFAGGSDGNLYAFNADTGAQLWKFAAGGVVGNPTVGL